MLGQLGWGGGGDLKYIQFAGRRLPELVKDALDTSKIDAGGIELHIETPDSGM
jgi:hypothetical protein